MNDPHAVALFYRVAHAHSVDYREAQPIDHEEMRFRVTIANEQARFEFKDHYATEDAAQRAIDDYIRVWEFSACLENGPDSFRLEFARAQIEDRRPPPPVPGVKNISVHSQVRAEAYIYRPRSSRTTILHRHWE